MALVSHDLILNLEAQRWRVEQIRENSARLATSFGTFTSTGWGEFVRDQVFEFGGVFVARPTFSYGYSLADGVQLVDTRYPRAFCFVSDWWTDKRGYYLGAYLAFAVDTMSPALATTVADPDYKLVHDISFQGVSMKQLPDYLLDE